MLFHLNDGCTSHTTADTKCCKTLLGTLLLHLMKECNKDTCSRCSDGMSECYRTAVRVELLFNIDTEVFSDCNRLSCECFVCLDDIEVFDLISGLGHNLLCSRNRSDTHDRRINTCKSAAYKCSHRLNTKFFSFFFGHYTDRCSTVVDT